MYQIIEYSKSGDFVAIISGCGKHRGTWESLHSKRTATKYAKQLQAENSEKVYKVVQL